MNSKKYILAIDQSTSASKVILFNKKAELVHRVSIPHQQFYPQPGFVEHDAHEIFENVRTGMKRLITETKINESEIAGIAITNQRETSVIWDKNTGMPVANAAVWQCQRGAPFCKELIKKWGHRKNLSKNRANHRSLFFCQQIKLVNEKHRWPE